MSNTQVYSNTYPDPTIKRILSCVYFVQLLKIPFFGPKGTFYNDTKNWVCTDPAFVSWPDEKTFDTILNGDAMVAFLNELDRKTAFVDQPITLQYSILVLIMELHPEIKNMSDGLTWLRPKLDALQRDPQNNVLQQTSAIYALFN